MERGGQERVGGEIVHLVGAVNAKYVFETVLVEKVVTDDLDPVEKVPDPVDVGGGVVGHRSDDPVPFSQEEFGQIRSILAADSRDQCSGHREDPLFPTGPAVVPVKTCSPRWRCVSREAASRRGNGLTSGGRGEFFSPGQRTGNIPGRGNSPESRGRPRWQTPTPERSRGGAVERSTSGTLRWNRRPWPYTRRVWRGFSTVREDSPCVGTLAGGFPGTK